MKACILTPQARELIAASLINSRRFLGAGGTEADDALEVLAELFRSELVAFSVVIAPGGPDVGRL